ncbi:tyrosine-type recombinase/integrase [Acetobacterium wieringae]|uniref:tyrosine-type recombinase/integrase n=1 Tax=Acetobacterium wieringae TaxID=52694 RepID=UPI0026EF9735|nr:tyrosine-type recombinase/integrase [Acetobacterium wieringae]
MLTAIDQQIVQTDEKKQEILTFLKNAYWNNDIWHTKDPFFNDYRTDRKEKKRQKNNIDFTGFNNSIKIEIKYMIAQKLITQEVLLNTVRNYSTKFELCAEFLKMNYPQIDSIRDLPWDRFISQWKLFLVNKGYETNDKGRFSDRANMGLVNWLHSFAIDFYDTRNEYEKDVWDCRNIPGFKITNTYSNYKLDFTPFPSTYRNLVKQYLKFKSKDVSLGYGNVIRIRLQLFFEYIYQKEPKWNDLTKLTRKHIEDYICFAKEAAKGTITLEQSNLSQLKSFLEYIERSEYDEAPLVPVSCLIFKEDIPNQAKANREAVKYFPEGVLHQLEENLENISPPDCIPIVILLRASGWRISDIFNLRYDTCLEKTTQGWYLCGDIEKTQVLNHRVPITDEIQHVVSIVIKETKAKSTDDNNPNHLLFVRYSGKRMGRCPLSSMITNALNRLAKSYNITDDQGNTFHFKNHAFRHTKAVELINNGMNILHVQKWLAHRSPEMTLTYAKVLDTSMHKAWEEASSRGLFRMDEHEKIKEIELSETENEDVIKWENIRTNLDAVRMPLGYCMKPKKQKCQSQTIPCLICSNLCTTPDFIPQYEHEIEELKVLIERAKNLGQETWTAKSENLKQRYEDVLNVLRDGKIRHEVGKKGREYIGKERDIGNK